MSYMGSKTQLTYHLIFVTKYRKPALLGIEERVYAALEHAARGGLFSITEMGVDLGNHVHLVVEAEPTVSVAQIVRRLKQLTTLELWATSRPELSQFYWGKKRRLWNEGYFAGSVGSVSRESVLDYVRRQAK